MRIAPLAVFLTVLSAVLCGCDGGGGDESREQIQAERAARAKAEERLAEERRHAELERQVAEAKLKEESQRELLAVVLAVAAGCLAAATILWAARERRIRMTLTSVLKHSEERSRPDD